MTTPFTIGQEVTMPQRGHTRAGTVVDVKIVDGEERVFVRDARGVVYDFRFDALYARQPDREAAAAAVRAAAELEVAAAAAALPDAQARQAMAARGIPIGVVPAMPPAPTPGGAV